MYGRFAWRATEHALPGSEPTIQLAADLINLLPQAGDLAVADVGLRQHVQGVDFLQQHRDRLFELQSVRHQA